MRTIELIVPDDATLMTANLVRAWPVGDGAALFSIGQAFDLTKGTRFSFECENMREQAEAYE